MGLNQMKPGVCQFFQFYPISALLLQDPLSICSLYRQLLSRPPLFFTLGFKFVTFSPHLCALCNIFPRVVQTLNNCLCAGRHGHSNGTSHGVGGRTEQQQHQGPVTSVNSWNNGNGNVVGSGNNGIVLAPLERSKSKFASLSRLFKPWKWRVRRHKSDKLESVSQCKSISTICPQSQRPLIITFVVCWFSCSQLWSGRCRCVPTATTSSRRGFSFRILPQPTPPLLRHYHQSPVSLFFPSRLL